MLDSCRQAQNQHLAQGLEDLGEVVEISGRPLREVALTPQQRLPCSTDYDRTLRRALVFRELTSKRRHLNSEE